MGGYFDLFKEVVDSVKAGVNEVNELKDNAKGLVTDVKQQVNDTVSDVQKTLPTDEIEATISSAKEKLSNTRDKLSQ